jgi:hypothetical protein
VCLYTFIDKKIYYENKKQIEKFFDKQDVTKLIFNKNSDRLGRAELHVEHERSFQYFVENTFRKVGKNIIKDVGVDCEKYKELKEMNVMIPEMYEKM